MAVVVGPQERAWNEAEADTIALMGTINVAVARLVANIAKLIVTNGWVGHGIRSPEHWVMWKACIGYTRAANLVRIARRAHELPACWALFEAGRLTEDAMVAIAKRAPAERDTEVAEWAPGMLVAQLHRALASCPELPNGDPNVPPRPPREHKRTFVLRQGDDGWGEGRFELPNHEIARVQASVEAGRDAEYRDLQGLEPDADLTELPDAARRPGVTQADGFLRAMEEGGDALDATHRRTGHPGERHKVVLHVDVAPDGTFGPGQLHGGPVVPESVARYLRCDAEVIVAAYQAGKLIGITPTERTVNRHLRRVIERRDQGCAHPLCTRTRWLHIHHIVFWEHRGLTIPPNLVCLCPEHHRELHAGEFSIEGNPEDGTLRFFDSRGSPIEPPGVGPPELPRPGEPSPFTPPYGEPLDGRWFGWN